ncbi:dihydrofolate reductase [Zafaria cholistanensis]|uniref:Dihydrofolate reductase n=1 Tax=Zafaria cholistanensis TaxID=1682741 RepID=A0A5A7NUB3_9MICC|nr:dihydrofolate reductase family protein [Zafaria cholistanensis]GER23437.1 dihydrofolate reductase [Zafaria cholistanensis]
MARFRYYVAASVDGFIADRNNDLGWLLAFDGFEGHQQNYDDFLTGIGALVMGGETYAWMHAHAPGAWPYPGLPTWVLTHHEQAGWPGADLTFIRGDLSEWAPDIAADAGDKDVWVVGGGRVAGEFADAGLLDEIILFTMPVVLGGGRPLLAAGTPLRLEVTSSREYGGGIRETRYTVLKDTPAAQP